MSRLGDTIKEARLAAQLTEKALGKKAGVAESFIKQVEMGTRIVSDEQAQRILKLLGIKDPVSTELEVAAEPARKIRAKPKPLPVAPVPELPKQQPPSVAYNAASEPAVASDAWLDALSGIVKRVPVMDTNGVVTDHIPVPISAGKIAGGAPDKVIFHRCEDDSLRGYRIHAGDLLLTVPSDVIEDEQIMLVQYKGMRIARKLIKQSGSKVLMQSYDHEYVGERVDRRNIVILGKCVKLERQL